LRAALLSEMILVSINSGSDAELRRVKLSDGSLFSLRTCYRTGVYGEDFDRRFIEGGEISAGEEGALRFAAACLRTERTALRLIARAEQTAPGLALKLKRRGSEPSCISAVLRRLEDLGIVDNRRFAGLWIQSRLARRVESPRRLLTALRSRGIGQDDAEAALKSLLNFPNESALLRGYIQKHRLLPAEEQAGDRSLKYRLKSEGFSSAVIQDYWEEQGW
jgi:regulatory protein